jgi:hypothetical protein
MRSITSLLTALAIALTIGAGWFAPGHAAAGGMMQVKTGDLNADGAATSVDAQLLLQIDAGLNDPPAKGYDVWFAGADVNCDTTVNAMDATVILQASAGLYDLRP